ncbi:hypothetical protein BDV27DRAFT_156618 [Aspergillus caelatus]|uniref:Fungal-specific transcription factor domain-containing protein n=1 Tax=Aspergillus caelatus TaxID=61420 RepID=A0A5N7A8Q9_9EURO|nr:uncharacterized protein BDV27DRAFT_156618 [Aspergillus caelatus]KAE8365738.1 hypothetical protein BDV27DRAFT_156618 [Aspergillus caelatus]
MRILLDLPGTSSDERRCFNVFQTYTVPMMVSWFDSEVWQQIVPRMSQAEPAIYHAVVALSVIHEDSEITGSPPGAMNIKNSYHRFALAQYSKAASMLCKRLGSNDPQVRAVALMCCIMFSCFDLSRGNYKAAFTHLQKGVQIMEGQRVKANQRHTFLQSPNSWSPTEYALTRVLIHVDVQSAHFGESGPLLHLYPITLGEGGHNRPSLNSLAEVKQSLDPIMNNILRFRRSCEPYVRGEISGLFDIAGASAEQRRIQAHLHDHIRAFEEFVLRQASNRANSKDARSTDLMRLQNEALANILETSLVTCELIYDNYLPAYKRITQLAKEIITSFQAEYGTYRPCIVMDMGVIPSLLWVCLKCRDFQIRHQAVELLERWPHREGAYDSNLLVQIVKEHMVLEQPGPCDGDRATVPESARIDSVTRINLSGEE